MAMSHADCDHPRTPAGRAACRKGNRTPGHDPRCTAPNHNHRKCIVPAVDHTEDWARSASRKRKPRGADTRDPVQRLRDHQKALLDHPSTAKRLKARTGDLKRPGTRLRTIGDLPDVPRMLAHGCRIAWDHDWEVKVGHQFNDNEKRIVIDGDVCEVSLVWRPSLPDGVWGVFVRKTSITHRIDAGVEHAMRIAAGEEPFEW